ETRPIGIPTLEDKVLQRAIVMLLQPIYEQDFKPCSYGFRPGRSAHQALEDLQHQLTKDGGGWILEVDVRKFFDTLDHAHLRELLRRRVRDGIVLRLIGKWLNAGVMEGGAVTYPPTGSPQGGVSTPPTMLRTAPFGACLKRAGLHLVHDADAVFTHLHLLDQGAHNLSAHLPVCVL